MPGAALFQHDYEPIRVQAAKPVPNLEGFVREFMAVLDPTGVIPMPTIRVVKRSGVDWEGIIYTSAYRKADGIAYAVTGRIDIQAHIAEVEKSARRIVAHECCHLAQYWAISVGVPVEQDKLNKAENEKEEGHGRWFMAQAAKINAVYGADFVTPFSDQTYERGTRPSIYYLMIKRTDADYIKFEVSARPSAKQIEYLRLVAANYPPGEPKGAAKLVRAPEDPELRGAAAIGNPHFSRPNAPTSIKLIQDLWDHGQDVLQTFAEKPTSFPFWIVMESRTNGQSVDFAAIKVLTPQVKQYIGRTSRYLEVRILRSTDDALFDVLPTLGKQPRTGRWLERALDHIDAAHLWATGTPCPNAQYDLERA